MNPFLKKILFLTYISLCSTFLICQDTIYFKPYSSILLESPVLSLASGDFNSDGLVDVAVATSQKEKNATQPLPTDNKIIIYLQQQDGSLLKTYEYSGNNGNSIASGDLNSDGRTDLVMSSISGFSVYYQNNNGTFNNKMTYSLSTPFTRVSIGDFNSDGKLDICGINTSISNSNVYISYQNTNGSFGQVTTISAIKGESLFVADLNNDGKDDILLQAPNSSTYSNLAIIYQNLSGNMASPKYIDLGGEEATTGVAIGDINGDYINDISLITHTNGSDFKLSIFSLDSSNEFVFEKSYPLPFEPNGIKISDINLDSRKDVVISHATTGHIGVYFQNIDGELEDSSFYQIPIQTELTTQGFAIADINNDNAPDILIANPETGFNLMYHLKPAYYITHIANEPEWETYLVVDNTENSILELLVEQRKDSGGLLLNSIFVDPHESFKFQLKYGNWAKVEYKRGNGLLRETFINVEATGKGIAEFYLSPDVNRTLNFVFPHYNASNMTWMGISVLNPWESDAFIDLTAYDTQGNIIDTLSLTLPAKNHIATYVDTLFSNVNLQNISRIHLTSDLPVKGINISGLYNEKLLFTRATQSFNAATYSISHIAKRSEGWITKLIVENTNSISTNASLSLYNSGEFLGNYNFSIMGNGSKVIDLDTILGVSSYPECGFVTTTSNNLIFRESFINTDENGGGTAEFLLNTKDNAFLKYTYPFFKSDEITWLGIAIFNSSDTEASLTISASTESFITSVTTLSLPPHTRYKGLLNELFPGLPEYDNIANITITSDQKLSGINISGSETSRLLFGPAISN